MRVLQEIENAVSYEYFKDVRKRLGRHSPRPSVSLTEKLNAPGLARRISSNQVCSSPSTGPPSASLYRRHSSVERYLETKELDSFSKEGQLKSSTEPNRHSVNFENEDLFDYVDFSSSPQLPSANYEATRSPRVSLADKKQSLPRVTFSESTVDVKSASLPSQRQGAATPSMLDFELDVVVDIDSGKCVLHSEAEKEEEDLLSANSRYYNILQVVCLQILCKVFVYRYYAGCLFTYIMQ